ncbi:TPA: M24 family metallopeptidase, partial [Candidatus Poribacteria bacterium]|nr:M24 family metallopeptidase [Candidatus Poribacteria bacterium]
VDTIEPGVKSSEIQTAMAQVLDQQNVQASLPHGHGLGLEIRDYPIIVPKNDLYIRDDCVEIPSDLPLETNMVVNLEASIFRLEMGPYTLSNPFLSQQTDVNP